MFRVFKLADYNKNYRNFKTQVNNWDGWHLKGDFGLARKEFEVSRQEWIIARKNKTVVWIWRLPGN